MGLFFFCIEELKFSRLPSGKVAVMNVKCSIGSNKMCFFLPLGGIFKTLSNVKHEAFSQGSADSQGGYAVFKERFI